MPKSVPPEPWNVNRRGLAEPVVVELGGAGAVMTAVVEAVGAAGAGLGGVGGRRIFSSAAA